MDQPQAPSGFQRPGVPGAGNVLDPAVRAEVREKLHPGGHEDSAKAEDDAAEQSETRAGPQTTTDKSPEPATHRAGPFPHGDVDLRGFAANVPPGPVRPRRGGAGRRFYFLPADTTASDASPAPTPPNGPKPG